MRLLVRIQHVLEWHPRQRLYAHARRPAVLDVAITPATITTASASTASAAPRTALPAATLVAAPSGATCEAAATVAPSAADGALHWRGPLL